MGVVVCSKGVWWGWETRERGESRGTEEGVGEGVTDVLWVICVGERGGE